MRKLEQEVKLLTLTLSKKEASGLSSSMIFGSYSLTAAVLSGASSVLGQWHRLSCFRR